jgi:hypothetical protein
MRERLEDADPDPVQVHTERIRHHLRYLDEQTLAHFRPAMVEVDADALWAFGSRGKRRTA